LFEIRVPDRNDGADTELGAIMDDRGCGIFLLVRTAPVEGVTKEDGESSSIECRVGTDREWIELFVVRYIIPEGLVFCLV
jgi:hypothetical protein